MRIDTCDFSLQIHQFQDIRDEVDNAYGDLISDTTEENRRRYKAALTDYLYAQLYLIVNLRDNVNAQSIELEQGYLVWDKDWPHRVHIINTMGNDRCDRCHGHKLVEIDSFHGKIWVECSKCNGHGRTFVTLMHRPLKRSNAS